MSDSVLIPVIEDMVVKNNGEIKPKAPKKIRIRPVTCMSRELAPIIRSISYYSINDSNEPTFYRVNYQP